MSIKVTRDKTGLMKQRVQIREHTFSADVSVAEGGEDAGPSPHDLYDAALGSCKALTMLWFAKRKNIPVDDIEVTIERDSSQESKGIYKLKALVSLTGDLSDEQREALLKVAGKCPLHKLMTEVTTEIETVWR
ncbi:MAG TPA: OsmC family protein [Spongiibacteraceae bacterium]|nr:OsmC family protein [Spongiibacteraceae bacterium]